MFRKIFSFIHTFCTFYLYNIAARFPMRIPMKRKKSSLIMWWERLKIIATTHLQLKLRRIKKIMNCMHVLLKMPTLWKFKFLLITPMRSHCLKFWLLYCLCYLKKKSAYENSLSILHKIFFFFHFFETKNQINQSSPVSFLSIYRPYTEHDDGNSYNHALILESYLDFLDRKHARTPRL